MRMIWVLTTALTLLASPAHAEKLLGPDGDQAGDEAPSAAKKKHKKKKAKAPPPAASDDEVAASEPAEARSEPAASSESSGGHFTLAGGFGSSSGTLNAQLTVGYYFNRYVGLEASYYYYKFDSNGSTGEQYGPELDAVLRFANPTIVTPYIGAGPGYTKWRRATGGEVFDSSNCVTANWFGGIDLRLTQHFGIGIMRKEQTYLGDPPRTYDDHRVRDAKSSWTTNIGFRLAL